VSLNDGASDKETTYRPFGETVDTITDPTALLETKGFIPLSGFEYLKPLPRQWASGLMRGQDCNA